MSSCVAQVLCIFAAEYGDFLSPVCQNSDLIVDLIKDSQVSPVQKYVEGICESQKDLEESFDWLINVTQEKFRARPSGQERKEASVPEWVNGGDEASKIIDIFTKLKFISEKPPKKSHYPCGAIFGSTAPNMEKRIGYFVDLVNGGEDIDKVFLLVGTRLVDSGKYYDGSQEYLDSVAKKFAIKPSEISEEHLAMEVYERLCLSNLKCQKIDYQLVYSSKDAGRATTLDTLIEFSKYFKSCSATMYVSTAPFIMTQNEIVAKFAASDLKYNHVYETVGSSASVKEAPNKAKAAHYLLMSFAEALYSAKDRIKNVISRSNISMKDEL